MDKCPRCDGKWNRVLPLHGDKKKRPCHCNCDRCCVVLNEYGLFLHISTTYTTYTINWNMVEHTCSIFQQGDYPGRSNEIQLPWLSFKITMDELQKYLVLV